MLLAGALALGGCAAKPEAVRLDLTGVKPAADVENLAAFLSAAVAEDGRIKPAEAKRLMGRLDAQLRLMAVAGPTATAQLYPDPPARWAYWYNARAAWSIKLAAMAGFPEQLPPEQMLARPFPLDGRMASLAEIDGTLLAETRRTGDFRLAACAPGVCVSFAPLPRTPYSGEDLPGRLEEDLDALVLAQRRLVVDVEKRQVRLPAMLWACRELVIREFQRTYGGSGVDLISALLWHLGPLARWRLEEAMGYGVGPHRAGCRLDVEKPKIYFPGKVGKIEP